MNSKAFKNYTDLKQTIRRRFKIFKYSIIGLGGAVVILSSVMFMGGSEIPAKPENYDEIYSEIESINKEIESMNSIEDTLHQIATESDIHIVDINHNSKDYTNYQNHVNNINNILEGIENKINKKSKYYNDIIISVNKKKSIMEAMPSIMPISPDERLVGSGYGMRKHPIHKIRQMHGGVDFIAKKGTFVRATADGVVEEAKGRNGYGIMVKIQHGEGYETIYAHLSSILVTEGDSIKKGDVLGLVGSTGLSTGPHLHYEVIKNGKMVDPINYFYNDLTPEDYDKMITICNSAEMSMD